jgi:hypothetical protein
MRESSQQCDLPEIRNLHPEESFRAALMAYFWNSELEMIGSRCGIWEVLSMFEVLLKCWKCWNCRRNPSHTWETARLCLEHRRSQAATTRQGRSNSFSEVCEATCRRSRCIGEIRGIIAGIMNILCSSCNCSHSERTAVPTTFSL